MIPFWLLTAAKSKWTWYIVGAVVVLIASGVALHNFGVQRYNQGVMAERAAWGKVIEEARQAASDARAELEAVREERDAASANARAVLAQLRDQTQEEIRNAATVEDQYRIYRSHHDSVRNEAAANLARARADYLSSLGDGNPSGPRPGGFADRGPDATGSGRVFAFEGSWVGFPVREGPASASRHLELVL